MHDCTYNIHQRITRLVEVPWQMMHTIMDTNKRHSKRHKTLGMMSHLTDGKSSVMGIVEDLSASGLRIGQITLDFDDTVRQCSAVIHSPIGEFNIVLTSRWMKETSPGMYKTIGFEIVNPPDGWTEFVSELENGISEIALILLEDEEVRKCSRIL